MLLFKYVTGLSVIAISTLKLTTHCHMILVVDCDRYDDGGFGGFLYRRRHCIVLCSGD